VFIPASNQQFDQNIANALQFCDRPPAQAHADAQFCHMLVARTSQGGNEALMSLRHGMSAYPFEIGEEAVQPADATRRMNRMYRLQRHFYDATRRYYLLGRDRMIANLHPRAGANVLEIGCGTARNLVHAARLYPGAQFFGIDVSTEMLTSAIAAISRASLARRIKVAHGDATAALPQTLLAVQSFDHVMISYSLSMIPDWRRVLKAAVSHLRPGGRLHVVDFGTQERLPAIARILLLRWLAIFDVTPRDDLEQELLSLAKACGADLVFERPFRGYAQYAILSLPDGPGKP
jgi:S-adenosylmethionine-diacylgycerolhomoserine-N-methlytransferase